MSILFRQLYNFIYLLHSETETASIAAGFALGMVLGFSPLLSLQGLLVVLLILFFRVQFGAALVSMAFFTVVSPLLSGLFHRVGELVLGLQFLQPIYRQLYNLPLVPYTQFYNTVVMGAAVVSVILLIPVYMLSIWLVNRYRETVVAWMKETWLWNVWKSTSLYRWYRKYESVRWTS